MRLTLKYALQWIAVSVFCISAPSVAVAQEGESTAFKHYFHQPPPVSIGSIEADNCGDAMWVSWKQDISKWLEGEPDEGGLISGSTPGLSLFAKARFNETPIEMGSFEYALSDYLQEFKAARIMGGRLHCSHDYEDEKEWGVTLVVAYSVKFMTPIEGYTSVELRFKADKFSILVANQ